MSKKTLAIFLLIIVALMIVLLILYISQLMNISIQNQHKINSLKRTDVAMVKIELKDAESELVKLRELADDQKSIAKIEILFDQISFYKTELDKPLGKINKEIVDDFYNAGIWQAIVELKNNLENNGQKKGFPPALE